ncbi:MAG: formylglycine-generating enzyme family protein, partial [Propionibacteriaceae bacterium]|nr:formylglycine-generating enzyme family protein [Propionibacteriaceae bacterium]
MLLFIFCGCEETANDDIDGGTGGADGGSDTDTDGDTDTDSFFEIAPHIDAGVSDRCFTDGGVVPIDWVVIDGGTYLMGSPFGQGFPNNQLPAHDVTIPTFEIMRTEVTVCHYADCFADGKCTHPKTSDMPNTSDGCNWMVRGNGNHPVNCVDVYQAEAFCQWAGGRLPSESEWEFVARGRGRDIIYPWGDELATCEYAVMGVNINDLFVGGCGIDHTFEVCSRPQGNTAQGLCDVAGNVWEWVPDKWTIDYQGAPTDGSPWMDAVYEDSRVIRGGDYKCN